MLVVFIRSVLLVIVVFVTMRLMGKRQIGQLQPFELVVAIMISELGSVPMQDTSIPILFGIIPILCLLAIQLTLSLLSNVNYKARSVICGSPTILIDKGIIQEEVLTKELYSFADLIEQLRTQGWHDITNVHTAILETNGELSVIPKSMFKPADASMLKVPLESEGIANIVIIDGKIMQNNLSHSGKDNIWLNDKINQIGHGSVKSILFASISPNKTLYVQFKDNLTCSIT